MKTKKGDLFNLSEIDTDYYNDNQEKIELVSNTNLTKKCEKYLIIVNESFHKFDLFRREKDFGRAIEVLKDAYITTFELTESKSLKFAVFFRSTIYESLESIRNELRSLSKGIIRRKRFKTSFELAEMVLNELKILNENYTLVKKENHHYIESYYKRNVS